MGKYLVGLNVPREKVELKGRLSISISLLARKSHNSRHKDAIFASAPAC